MCGTQQRYSTGMEPAAYCQQGDDAEMLELAQAMSLLHHENVQPSTGNMGIICGPRWRGSGSCPGGQERMLLCWRTDKERQRSGSASGEHGD